MATNGATNGSGNDGQADTAPEETPGPVKNGKQGPPMPTFTPAPDA